MYQELFNRFGFSADCPYPTNSRFYDFCKLYTSGSILGAQLLGLNEVSHWLSTQTIYKFI